MVARRMEAKVGADGTVTVAGLALPVGTEVDVIVLVRDEDASPQYALRGTPYTFEDPFTPVAVDDWEAAR